MEAYHDHQHEHIHSHTQKKLIMAIGDIGSGKYTA